MQDHLINNRKTEDVVHKSENEPHTSFMAFSMLIASVIFANRKTNQYDRFLIIIIVTQGIEYLLKSQLIGSLLANQANLPTGVPPLTSHACLRTCDCMPCLSTLQSAASASYPKPTTAQTAVQRGRTLNTIIALQLTEHTNHSTTEAASSFQNLD